MSFSGTFSALIWVILSLNLHAQTCAKYSYSHFSAHDSTIVPAGGTWWAQDKGRHLVGSMISTVFIGKFSQQAYQTGTAESQKWGAGITFSLGVAKEIFDSQKAGNRFSVEDLIANIAGIAIGIFIIGVH